VKKQNDIEKSVCHLKISITLKRIFSSADAAFAAWISKYLKVGEQKT